MIAQVLNREFLLTQVRGAQLGLEEELALRDRRGAPGPLDQFSGDEVAEFIALLEERSTGSEELEPSEPKDDFAFVPSDPLLSIVQSAFETTLGEQSPDAIVEKELPDGRRAGAPAAVTDTQLAGVELVRAPPGRRVWGQMEVTSLKPFSDPRWIWAGAMLLWQQFHCPAPFNATPPEPIAIADDARILLVGDWGSGLPRAQKVAARMREELDKGIGERREQHVIHLGDVYYAGSSSEYEKRFLQYWPVRDGEAVGSYSLNGNHDMYGGAHAYFGTCLQDPRFGRQGACSFFSLYNSNWQLLGLDTSYEDAGLHGGQAGWVREQLDARPAHRTVLLSHHQPFSAYEPGAEVLRQKIRPALETKRIDAWFWGHEHRCLAYKDSMNVGFASCVGHGGIPEYLTDKTPRIYELDYEYRERYGTGREPWGMFGFAVLDLDGDRMTVTYIDEDGRIHHTDSLAGRA